MDKNGFRLTDELDFGFSECALTASDLGFSSDYGLLVFIGLGSVFLGSGSFGLTRLRFTSAGGTRCAFTELVWTFGFCRMCHH